MEEKNGQAPDEENTFFEASIINSACLHEASMKVG